jgi:hypothetical protein
MNLHKTNGSQDESNIVLRGNRSYMQSVHITTNVVSPNFAKGEM